MPRIPETGISASIRIANSAVAEYTTKDEQAARAVSCFVESRQNCVFGVAYKSRRYSVAMTLLVDGQEQVDRPRIGFDRAQTDGRSFATSKQTKTKSTICLVEQSRAIKSSLSYSRSELMCLAPVVLTNDIESS